MSVLPPEPFAEGGPTQSKTKPGDFERELIHEVRNLAQAVALLRALLNKQVISHKRDRFIALLLVVSLASVLIPLGFLFWDLDRTQKDLKATAYSNCQKRNGTNAAFLALVTGVGLQIQQPVPGQPDNPQARANTLALFAEFTEKIVPEDCERLRR